MRISIYLKLLLPVFVIGLTGVPAHGQSTTLTGSVLTKVDIDKQPQLKPLTPVKDKLRATPRSARQKPRVITRTVIVDKRDKRTYFQRHPKVKSAVIGAGVGAGTGAVVGLISRRGILRGSAIGATTGAGVGLIRSSRTMRRHPIVKNTATGALAGLGLGWAGSRRGKTVVKSTAVGTAIGLGYSLFKKIR